MLNWLRNRKHVDEVHRLAARPFLLFGARQPRLMPGLWQSQYCCTISYFWTAVVTEEMCRDDGGGDLKLRTLREAFARLVEETRGTPHDAMRRVLPDGHPIRRRSLEDLKRVVDLYKGIVEDRHMIYPEYREAVYGDGRPAFDPDRTGLEKEFAYEILMSSYLAQNALNVEDEQVPS